MNIKQITILIALSLALASCQELASEVQTTSAAASITVPAPAPATARADAEVGTRVPTPAAPTKQDSAPIEAPTARSLPAIDAAVDHARAFLAADEGEGRLSWLEGQAEYPFDVDAKAVVGDVDGLRDALVEEVGNIDEQIEGQTTCEGISAAGLRAGGKWHYLDRLGARADSASITRDLDRMGLTEHDVLVNCYDAKRATAGFMLRVSQRGDTLTVRAFRN